MELFVYIDESGSIHMNDKRRYFAVGGYWTDFQGKNKIKSIYKRINKEVKLEHNIPMKKELKSYNYEDDEKIRIFKEVQAVSSFHGCAKVFDKNYMRKKQKLSNVFFNYAVMVLFEDCIIPSLSDVDTSEHIVFKLNVDNRNVGVGDLDDLEKYLTTTFCLHDYEFHVKYYDSSTEFGVQLADLIVNTFYNHYKNNIIVERVMPELSISKFMVSVFPAGRKI